MVNIGVSLPGVNVGVNLGGSPSPAPPVVTPTPTPPTTPELETMALTQQQLLVPNRDLNGATVGWVLRTIEYDNQETTKNGKPKNFNSQAPWNTNSYRVVSTP